jgi:hypothetical protein
LDLRTIVGDVARMATATAVIAPKKAVRKAVKKAKKRL